MEHHRFDERVGLICLSLLAFGCGDDKAAEPVQAVQEELGECTSFSQQYWAAQDGATVTLKSTSTHFCWLTFSQGDYDGGHGFSAGAYVLPYGDGKWHLETDATGSYGQARCTPYSCFSGDGVDDVVWISGGFGAIANSTGSCDHYDTSTWWGDAVTVIQSHPGPGRTAGGGEKVDVFLSSNAFSPSTLRANDCQNDSNHWIEGTANSLFVGTPSGGKLAHYTGSPFLVGGNATLNLGVYTDDAFCFFTHIMGQYRGGGESVRVYTVFESATGRYLWYARSRQGDDGNAIQATGRCYYYHQWDL